MLDKDRRKIIARLHRIEGQLRGLENQLATNNDALSVIAQFDAAIAASKGALHSYIEEIIDELPDEKRQRLLKRLIRKN